MTSTIASTIISTYREAATDCAVAAGADSTTAAAAADAVEAELKRPYLWEVVLKSGARLSWTMAHADGVAFQADLLEAELHGRPFVNFSPAQMILRPSAVDAVFRGQPAAAA